MQRAYMCYQIEITMKKKGEGKAKEEHRSLLHG